MAMNGKQRGRWLSDVISELQRYLSKARSEPEAALVSRALENLDDARQVTRKEDPS